MLLAQMEIYPEENKIRLSSYTKNHTKFQMNSKSK